MKKRIFTFLFAILLIVTVLPFSVSARVLTDKEKDLVAYLKVKVAEAEGILDLPPDIIFQTENFLAGRENPLTDDEIALIRAEVEAATKDIEAARKEKEEAEKAEQAGQTPPPASSSTQEVVKDVLEHVENAAGIVDCTVSTSTNKNNVVINIKDANGSLLASAGSGIIKVTGFGAEPMLIAGVVAAALVLAVAVVSKKARLF